MLKYRALSIFLFLLIFSCFSFAQAHYPFVVFSPPKCGTHLVSKALTFLLNQEPTYCLTELGTDEQAVQLVEDATKNNSFVVAHNFSLTTLRALIKKGYRILFVLRDPRDQLVSLRDWMREGQWYWIRASKIEDLNEQLEELITGQRYGFRCYDRCIQSRLDILGQIIAKNRYYITRFENLIGVEGHGSKELQLKEIYNIAALLKVPLTEEHALAISEDLFGHTRTFRHGQIGRWKEEFLPYHKELYKVHYGQVLINLGYETTLDW